MIRLILFFIILLAIVVLATANDELVQINYVVGTTPPLPLYFIMGGSFIAGGIAFTIMILPVWIKDKLEIRKLKRSIQSMEVAKNRPDEYPDSSS